MPNRLANENSPYLLQHAENPVDWYPWGSEALEKASREDKPILLSIGYAACHWCHVMAHESFEDPATADLMNANFVNIKVDREERPDLDGIYMSAVVAMTGQGGWPLTVFLTPDCEPFFGGTYFPPTRRYNMPSFREVLDSIHRVWRQDRGQVLESSTQITDHLRKSGEVALSKSSLRAGADEEAALTLAQAYDWKYGGWGSAPKFPQPMAIEFLSRRAARGDHLASDIAQHALAAMTNGGMYDVVGGGFSRYSTDNDWLVPHFEKMLYDNAQLALAYLHAGLVASRNDFLAICTETLDFVVRELTHSDGGFYSSLDADSEGEEGKYYLWSLSEIRAAIGDPRMVDVFLAAYPVSETGNFDGKNVLQRTPEYDTLADRLEMSQEDLASILSNCKAALLNIRQIRIPPQTDDKILSAWNGFALRAFAEAARYLARQDYLQIARRNASFLLEQMRPAGKLLRSWRAGKAQHNAYLEDYASLILGLLALYQTDPDLKWYQSALELAQDMLDNFTDPSGGFFDTRHDHDPLLTRPKDLQDNATPCGNSLAAAALLQLAAYTGQEDWRRQAEQMAAAMTPAAVRYPTAFANWLCAIDHLLHPAFEVAILGELSAPSTLSLVSVLWSRYRPNLVAAISPPQPPPGSPPLLFNRQLQNNESTAYVCQNFACQLPVTSPEALQEQLDRL